MKPVLFIIIFYGSLLKLNAQEVVRLKNGSIITVQPGVEMTTQGGITFENGSLLINNGATRLQNNPSANQSNWTDNSILGALGGSGLVVFNSSQLQQFFGTTHFYNLQMNCAGLNLNNNLIIENALHLVNGKINTNSYYACLYNNNSLSLLSDAANTGYTKSWINGNFRRAITTNTNTYDFPVGGAVRSNLLQFLNNNISGTSQLTASFGMKPGTDAGLNVFENGVAYTAVNIGGVWYLTPDVSPSAGNYSLQLYFNGFTGLSDNLFGILRRTNGSTNAADWTVPGGSSIESIGGSGRKLSDGFARRINISNFSQWGIGMTGSLPCSDCPSACTYTQGFYGNINGVACYNSSGTSVNSYQLMLNAFGSATSKIFGSVSSRRFFTLYKADITSKNIYKMLPGTGNSQTIAIDNIQPYDGAYYTDASTWNLVPIQPNGSQKGKINNLLLSQTISLWFNLRTSTSLANTDLSMDTLVTVAQTSCGSGILTGTPVKFGLPHNIVAYLNGGNGYSNNVNGLFQLANDVLGGANNSVTAPDVQSAVATINNAFDGCRVLTGAIPYWQPLPLTKTNKSVTEQPIEQLKVSAYPNPFDKQFSLAISSPVSGMAIIEFFDANGAKTNEQIKYVRKNTVATILEKVAVHRSSVWYSVRIGNYKASGKVMSLN